MPKKLAEKEDHLFKRGEIYWLYFRENGHRVRLSLKTKSKAEALKKLQAYRIKGPGTNFDAVPIRQLIDDYCERQHDAFNFTDSTARSTKAQLNSIAKIKELKSVKDLEDPLLPLALYTDLQYHKKANGEDYSEATARSYAMITHAFMNWLYEDNSIRQKPEKVIYSKRRAIRRKDVVVPLEKVLRLINFTSDSRAKFILYCGFLAGMRRNEIVMAKPGWFTEKCILIPESESTTVHFERRQYRAKDYSKTFNFRTKSFLTRKIPIRKEFKEFLNEFLPSCSQFCLENKGRGYGEIYRYDIRGPFENAITAFNAAHPGVLPAGITIHTMRHSFISNLANSRCPLYTALQVSAWSGDQLRTIQSNYFHSRIEGDELDGLT